MKYFWIISVLVGFLYAQVCFPSYKSIKVVSGDYDEFDSSLSNCKIYKNDFLVQEANYENSKIQIDIKTQRIKLLVFGNVAIDSPATTGTKYKKDKSTGKIIDKSTPLGEFYIKEKLKGTSNNRYSP